MGRRFDKPGPFAQRTRTVIQRQPFNQLFLIMASAALLVSILSIFSLYRTAIEQHELRLEETVKGQARLIEVIAQFDSLDNEDSDPQAADDQNESAPAGRAEPSSRSAPLSRSAPPSRSESTPSAATDASGDSEEELDPDSIDWSSLNKAERRRLRRELKRQGKAA